MTDTLTPAEQLAEATQRIAHLENQLARAHQNIRAYETDEQEHTEQIATLEDEVAHLTAQATLDAQQTPIGVSRVIRIRELEVENAELRAQLAA